MKVLIVGGTRFMGPVVAARLLQAGHEVTVFHRGETEQGVPEGVTHIHGDRDKLGEYREEFARVGPDVVLDMMLLTERQAIELVETMRGIASRLVVASSCDVYKNYGLAWRKEIGAPTEGKITEESALRENLYPYRDVMAKGPDEVLYHYDKILVERVVMDSGMRSTVLRLPMVYGPNDRQYRFWGYIKRMVDGRPAVLIDRAQVTWCGVRGYRDNCAEAIALAVTDERAAGRIYNVGEAKVKSEAEWIERIGAELGWRGQIAALPHEVLPEYLRTPLDWAYHLDVDTSRIREELGFSDSVEEAEGLRRTIAWERENPPKETTDEFDYAEEDRRLVRLSRAGSPYFPAPRRE